VSFFQQMGFGQAVEYVQRIGVLMNLLVLSLPCGAIVAIIRGKRTRPGETMVFAHAVLWTWVALLIGLVAYFFSGRWYSESGGPEPQVVAFRATIQFFVVLAVVVAIHVGLARTSRPRPAH
jgi:hypothetical protein